VVDVQQFAEDVCCAGAELRELLGWVLWLLDWGGLLRKDDCRRCDVRGFLFDVRER
jgi:hypothetical protein